MLIDKEYYDYDYNEECANRNIEKTKSKTTKKKSAKEISSMLERFGFKTKIREDEPKKISSEEAQKIVMNELLKK